MGPPCSISLWPNRTPNDLPAVLCFCHVAKALRQGTHPPSLVSPFHLQVTSSLTRFVQLQLILGCQS